MELMIWGNHKWRGATPAFRTAPKRAIESIPKAGALRMKTDPSLWARKYFAIPFLLTNGINAIVLISIDTQILSHLEDDAAIKVEITISKNLINWKGRIKTRGNQTPETRLEARYYFQVCLMIPINRRIDIERFIRHQRSANIRQPLRDLHDV